MNRMKTSALLIAALSLQGITMVGAAPPKDTAPVEKPLQFNAPQLMIQLVEATQFIHAGEARSVFNVNGDGLTAAVLDTGIRKTHVDFENRILVARNFTTDDGGDPDSATDRNGHGTNVAGIVGANKDHTGIAPGAKLVALKVLRDDGGGSFSSVENALQWVIDNHAAHGITVVNMSLGAATNDTDDAAFANDEVTKKIHTLRTLNIPVVIAAGNDFFLFKAEGMGYPGVLRECVSVGAVYDSNVGGFSYQSGAIAHSTGAGRFCPFSQRLHPSTSSTCRTDAFGPGAPITSSGIDGDHGESIDHGTSQASPVITGTILLLQQFHKRATGKLPSVDDLETWLRVNGVEITDGDDEDDNVPHNNKKYTRIDALAALQAARQDLTMQILLQNQPAKNLKTSPVEKSAIRAEALKANTK